MPLLAYFVRVGAVLIALLLLVNYMYGPSTPESSEPVAASVQPSLPKPRTTTGLAPYTVGVARIAPSVADRLALPAPATIDPLDAAPELQLNRVEPEEKPLGRARPKPKTVRTRASGEAADDAWRAHRDRPGYPSYPWRSSAEGTLGPH